MTEQTKGIVAVAAQTVISIATFFVAKAALSSLPPGPMVLIRTAGAAVLLAVLATLAKESIQPKKGDLWRLVFLGIVGVPLNQGLFLYGLRETTPAHASLVYALTPAAVLLIGALVGTERLVRGRAAGIALALVGVAIVLAPRSGTGAMRGDLLIVAAMVSWALYTALARGIVARLGSVRATAGALGIGAVIYAPFGIWTCVGFDFSTVDAAGWFGVAWLMVMSSTVAYLCWYYAIRRLAPSRVAVFNNLQPVGTSALAWAFGAEKATLPFVLGGVLVIAGVLLAQRVTDERRAALP